MDKIIFANLLAKYNSICIATVKKEMIKLPNNSNNIPCAALLFSRINNEVLDISTNKKHTKQNVFFHCETNLLINWFKKNKSWRLTSDVGIYCLLEPCYVCFFAMIEARVKLIIYSLANPRTNTIQNIKKISYSLIKKTEIIHHIYNNKNYKMIIRNYFKNIRENNRIKSKEKYD